MAMLQAGAPTDDIDMLMLGIEADKTLNELLASLDLPKHICRFVSSTFESIQGSSPVELAAIFLFGREDLIPDLFRGLVKQLNESQTDRYTFFE